MTTQVFIDLLNKSDVIQKNLDFEEDFDDELYDIQSSNVDRLLQEGINVNTHRWFEISSTYFLLKNGDIIGVRVINNIFSESMDINDLEHRLIFFEGKEIPTVTYKRK